MKKPTDAQQVMRQTNVGGIDAKKNLMV